MFFTPDVLLSKEMDVREFQIEPALLPEDIRFKAKWAEYEARVRRVSFTFVFL